MARDITLSDVDSILAKAWNAFHEYRNLSLSRRAAFMRAIASKLESAGDELLQVTAAETNLPLSRLQNEKKRTVFQLTSYAAACERGDWLEATIDIKKEGSKIIHDLRKMRVPLGPVVVYGASNFPFAYSTAGGDTASAFAAGCPVIVKAHPAHLQTSNMVAALIEQASRDENLPDGIFNHLDIDHDTAKHLVQHPYIKAVGFTGSFTGGMALYNWAQERRHPIPVFAEMGSTNPVFFLPGKMKTDHQMLAEMMAGSITLGVGQFCTNPGLMIVQEGEGLTQFLDTLAAQVSKTVPASMLHQGIYDNFIQKRKVALQEQEVAVLAEVENGQAIKGNATIAKTNAQTFIKNPNLHEEVFGPYSLVVVCRNEQEMVEVAKSINGQLTASLMADNNDIINNAELMDLLKNICGRYIMNGVPTGVEVCQSMHHGGPHPATTDSRFTAVGADAIKRFSRPLCFQNWENQWLPPELQNENPLQLARTVNDVLTRDAC